LSCGSKDGVPPVRSTLQESALGVAVWRERLSFATKCFFGVGGSAILSTGDYRAFRSRADDTWAQAPGKVCHRQVTSEKTIS